MAAIAWVDNIKLVASVFVLLGHINNPFQSFIFSWHMPLFFIVAGFFVSKHSGVKFHGSDLRLLKIFFLFSIIGFVAEYLKREVLGREQIDVLEIVLYWIIFQDYSSLKGTYGFVLWFLPCVVGARYILRNLYSEKISLFLLFSIFVVIGLEAAPLLQLPFSIDNSIFVISYLIYGGFLYRKVQFLGVLEKKIIIVFGVVFLVVLYSMYGVPNIDLASKKLDYYGFVWSIIICSIFVFLFNLVGNVQFINSPNSLSLLIFVIHPYTNNISIKLCEYMGVTGWEVFVLVSLGICFLMWMAMNVVGEKIA